jgi:hypothetical protein
MTTAAPAPVAAPVAVDVSQQPATPVVATEAAKAEAPAIPEWQKRRDAARIETPAEEPAKVEAEPVKEAPKEEPKAETPPDPNDAALGQLASKMAAVRRERAELKRQQAEFRPQVEFAQRLQAAAKTDALEAMRMVAKQAGVEFHELYSKATRQLVSDAEPPDPAQVATKAAEEAFQRQMAAAKEAYEKQQTESQQAIISQQFQASVQHIQGQLQTGSWPLLGMRDPGMVAKAALDEAAREFASSRKVLDFSEVLDSLETRLQAQAEKDYQARQRKLAEGAQKPGAAPAHAAPQVDTPTGQQDPRPRTLTHTHAQDGGPPRPLDWRERRRRFSEEG